jgi:hypothetical protein
LNDFSIQICSGWETNQCSKNALVWDSGRRERG